MAPAPSSSSGGGGGGAPSSSALRAAAAVQIALFCAAAAAGTALSRRRRAAASEEATRGEADGSGGSAPRREDESEPEPSSTASAGGGEGRPVAAERAAGRSLLPSGASSSGDYSSRTEDPQRQGRGLGQGEHRSVTLRPIRSPGTVTVTYSSTTGTCSDLARIMAGLLRSKFASSLAFDDAGGGVDALVQVCKVDELDWWDEILNPPEEEEEDGDDADDSEAAGGNGGGGRGAGVKKFPPAVILILPTWTGGTLPPVDPSHPSDQPGLLSVLDDVANDWRVAPNPLRPSSSSPSSSGGGDGEGAGASPGLQVAVFGVGSSAYDPETFCRPARRAYELLVGRLGARPIGRGGGGGGIGTGDVEAQDVGAVFEGWAKGVAGRLAAGAAKLNKKKGRRLVGKGGVVVAAKDGEEGCCGGEEAENSCACKEGQDTIGNGAADEEKKHSDDYDSAESDDDEGAGEPDVIDLEDMGDAMKASLSESKSSAEPGEMVTPRQAAQLRKEGYKLVGTHSAVKLCRWTKHQLRGRGGCYKHTFYGITSYRCMEATPSLACANKCVFCWRHHKNPVGREWRWKTDDPHDIVEGAIAEHVKMIKEARGIPGVRRERWEEAHTVRHCALSLVGEPIMYPRIDELLADLHARDISTFLVTNGQHPGAIESLRPVTQLYVSVDAPTKSSLIEIDRPLFSDAWERLRQSLSSLKNKGQRTVARLTVVKGWNTDEVGGYAELVALGRVSLVEVKGVTFCGKSDASNLTMSNTPWHHEVVALTVRLRDELARMREDQLAGRANGGGKVAEEDLVPEYGLACEHRHSCSVLLARADQFARTDPSTGRRTGWNTWIDYDEFSTLAARHAADPAFEFGAEDYAAPTPGWALFGSDEEGFDPTDTRHRKKGKRPLYAAFDGEGVPTQDSEGRELGDEERERLRGLMEERRRAIAAGERESAAAKGAGRGSRGGERTVEDASLMFRGLVVGQA